MKLLYTTISGHRVELDEPTGSARTFLDRVRAAADDKRISENALIALIYSEGNPILEPGVVPGRGMVTKETLANPLYRVLTDLLNRKRIAEKKLDVDAMAARFTMRVSEAAETIGVSQSAVQQAIAAGRLPSWVKDGKHFLPPAAVAAFKPERRGPAPAASGKAKRRIRRA